MLAYLHENCTVEDFENDCVALSDLENKNNKLICEVSNCSSAFVNGMAEFRFDEGSNQNLSQDNSQGFSQIQKHQQQQVSGDGQGQNTSPMNQPTGQNKNKIIDEEDLPEIHMHRMEDTSLNINDVSEFMNTFVDQSVLDNKLTSQVDKNTDNDLRNSEIKGSNKE